MKINFINHARASAYSMVMLFTLTFGHLTNAQVKLVKEVEITDKALHFNGVQNKNSGRKVKSQAYDYAFGRTINPHGDCIKVYKHFVFLTWYRGGKGDRHVMLTRYNMKTGVSKTIEFPHQHTGFNGKWWIGETHNTIGIGICPKNGSIHMLYDMHRNGKVKGFENDYLRYSYTEKDAATVADKDFTINLFVNSKAGNYKHLSFPGIKNVSVTKMLTYPAFFTNDEGELFMKNRFGYSANGRYLFARYDGNKWHGYTDFNYTEAQNHGSKHNWGLYGDIKFVNGRIRIAFQRRSSNKKDKYEYQNGIYYAYSDDPNGLNEWKDFTGKGFERPLGDADRIKIAEPGDWVKTTKKDSVSIVGGFDWTVTGNEDVHIVSMVKDKQYNVTKKLHTYKKATDSEFTTVEYNAGSSLYTSGNDVYVIGLNKGRVNIVKTQGGTSNFKEVYQHTSGPTFDKGVVQVYDGKLYYYLLKSGVKSDTCTTYLQVFDLGIDGPNDELTVKMTAPANNSSFELGNTITLKANATGAAKVNFRVNGIYLKQDQTAPYQVLWTPTTPGTHTIDAVAFDAENNKVTAKSRTVKITQSQQAPSISFKQPTGNPTVNEGYALTVVTNASDKDGTISNVKLYIDNNLVRQENVAPYEWGKSGTPKADELNGLTPGSYELKAVATDNDGLTATKKITLTVKTVPFTIESVNAEQAPNVATNLLDGNTNDDTRWSAQGFPKSVMFDLGLTREITGTNMWTYLNRAYQYTIEVSPYKGSGFKTLVDKTNNTSTSQPLSDNFNATGRYVRLNITGAHNYDKDWVSINEFEILINGQASKLKGAEVKLDNLDFEPSISIYPNPVNSLFTIKLNTIGKSHVSIFNATGAIVFNKTCTQKAIQFSKDNVYKAGVYYVLVIGENQQVYRSKFIVK